ncbi:23S rRNA pseudouridine(955/2504/2580) synthase RluC [Blochmannia endosymbiont of Camponotus sp. C-003]|uniref:23S rRNA pseudouridine(955/2504/2580) synthase RluC n=1 Tax=unclassified Candidatus Blochmanniella TaxID=711328 RepID=UPI0020251885|nr:MULTISPECIES: 23S rRNA pseudouridine(955/2504/2580) synthase RluC [unclassified Candidatus Blochmannia]URJ23412.1 23S rRNA pseudouridine(955/2504/2580) synthase RluC [Blochmannia endosymbiont of Camponotus sp. C-003]URJ28885.1 23S rRNA pseudouridine(955/2504/2580) synthase RluC [Blochmannia endosymbiont of Camponotus sp. C-046]
MKEHDIQVHFIRISSNVSGQRIDNFLYTYLKVAPKSMIYRIIRTGAIRVNKKRIKFQYKLKVGDLLRVPPLQGMKINRFNTKYMKEVAFLQNIIIYEDDYLLALNKPTGIAAHGGSGLKFGVIEGLRALRPKAQFLELVHRLDRETSGVLLVAKKRTALVYLHEQLRLQNMKKEYLALVHGRWDVNLQIVSVPLLKKNTLLNSNKVVCIDSENGKSSTTHFKIKEYFNNVATLMIIKPITGRTHQIRVHTQYTSHPIVGDRRYGNCQSNARFKRFGFNRLFLHASILRFIHPNTKKKVYIYAPYDQLFHNCLFFLRNLVVNSYDCPLENINRNIGNMK